MKPLGFTVLLILAISALDVDSTSGQDAKSYLAPYLGKKYELYYTDDKFDNIMKALGVGFLKRTLAKLAKPIMELTESDGKYTLRSVSTFKDYSVTFNIGEEFLHVTPYDRSVKCKFTQDKNKLIQVDNGDKTVLVEREFSKDEVVVTTKVDNIVSVRKYKRL